MLKPEMEGIVLHFLPGTGHEGNQTKKLFTGKYYEERLHMRSNTYGGGWVPKERKAMVGWG